MCPEELTAFGKGDASANGEPVGQKAKRFASRGQKRWSFTSGNGCLCHDGRKQARQCGSIEGSVATKSTTPPSSATGQRAAEVLKPATPIAKAHEAGLDPYHTAEAMDADFY